MSVQDVLDRISQISGLADFAVDLLPGLTADIAESIIAAEADPTAANVERVFELYARHDVTPPAKLTAHLLLINEQRHPEDTVRGDITPWLIAGAIVLFLFFRKR